MAQLNINNPEFEVEIIKIVAKAIDLLYEKKAYLSIECTSGAQYEEKDFLLYIVDCQLHKLPKEVVEKAQTILEK